MKIEVTSGDIGVSLARARMMPEDKRDPELIGRLENLQRQIPDGQLDTAEMYHAAQSGAVARPDQKRAFSLMYLKEHFGMDGDLPEITRSQFGKELSEEDAYKWTVGILEARHGKSKFDEFQGMAPDKQASVAKNETRPGFFKTLATAGLNALSNAEGEEDAAGNIDKHKEKLFQNDLPKRLVEAESRLTPENEKLGRFIAVTAEPMEVVDALSALEPQDRAAVMDYVSLLTPERDLNWFQQVAPRMRDSGKRSIFAIKRSVENNVEQMDTVLEPSRTYAAIDKVFPDNRLKNGQPIFDDTGGFASDDSKAAVFEMLVSRLDKEYRSTGTALTWGWDPQGETAQSSEELAGQYIDSVPQAFQEGRAAWEKRGIEREVFQIAELDRFKKVPLDSALSAMEMSVDMAAAIGASALTGSPLGGIGYTYARVQSELQDTLEYDHGVKHDTAFWYATAASVPTALVEYAQIKGVSSGLKSAEKGYLSYLQGNWNGFLTEAMKQRGITTLEEIGEESVQSLIEQGMKLAAARYADAEGVNPQELFGNWLTDTIEAAKVMPWMMGPAMGADVVATDIMRRNMRNGDPAKLHEIGVRMERMKQDIRYEGPSMDSAGRQAIRNPADVVPQTVLKKYRSAGSTAAKMDVLRQEGLENRAEDFHRAESFQALEKAYAQESGKILEQRRALEPVNSRGDVTQPDGGIDTGMIQRLQERAKGAMELVEIPTQAELPVEVKAQLEAEYGAGARPYGFFMDGKVYLIPENMGSETQGGLAWAHEQGHGAVEALGAAQDVLLANVESLAGGAQRMRALIPDLPESLNGSDLAHEYIAKLAEQQIDPEKGKLTGANKQIWNKLTAWAENWLGLSTQQTLDDRQVAKIVRDLMRGVFQGSEKQAKPVPQSFQGSENNGAYSSENPDIRFSVEQDWNQRESAVTVALRMLSGEDMSFENADALLKENFPSVNTGDTIRRAQEIVSTVEASGDVLSMDQQTINQSVRQAEADRRYSDKRQRATSYMKGVYDEQDRTSATLKKAKGAARKVEVRDRKLEQQKKESRESLAALRTEYRQKTQDLQNELKQAKRSAREAMTGQREDIQAKIDALESYIKSKVPAGSSDIMKLAAGEARKVLKTLTQVAQAETRARRVDEAVQSIDRIFYKAQMRDVIADIDTMLKTKVPKVGKNKILRGDPLTPEIHEKLELIREAWKMRGPQNWDVTWDLQAQMESLNQKLDEMVQQGKTMEEMLDTSIQRDKVADKLWAHETYGDINGKSRSLKHLIEAHKDLTNLLQDGKRIHDLEQQMFRKEKELDKWQAMESITRGQRIATTKAGRRKRNYSDKNMLFKALDTFDSMHQSWEFMLDKVIEPGDGILQGPLTTKYGTMAHNATVKKDANIRHYNEMFNARFKEIFGLETDRDVVKKMRENSERIESTGVFEYSDTMEKEELPLSKNEAYKLYQLWMDETLHEALIKNGVTAETIRQIIKFIGPETLAWAKWQVKEFYPTYHHTINPVFRRMFSVNMPNTPNYTPVYRHISGRDVSDMDPVKGQNEARASVNNMSLKSRVANLRDFELMDGDSVLLMHVSNMEHFKAWAEPLRLMNSLFRDGEVQEAVKQFHGTTAQRIINRQLDDFARGGVDSMMIIRGLDKFRSNFTKSVIALKVPIFFKQLASIPAYAMDMPLKHWASGELEFWKNPAKAIKALGKSDFMIDRYGNGWERDVILAMNSSMPNKMAGIKSWTDRMMFMTAAGDKAAILVGGYPVYQYHYNLQKQAGKSDAVAQQEAIRQFEITTRRTQQSGAVMDLGQIQRGGSMQKLFTMFSTSSISYYRSVSAGVRVLTGQKGGSKAEAMKRVIIGHFLLPTIFQFIANGGRWDDEDQLRAAILGSMNRLFVYGDAADFIITGIISHDIRSAVGVLQMPIGDVIVDVGYAVTRLSREIEEGDLTLADVLYSADKFAAAAGKVTGIPYEGARNEVKGVAEAVSGETKYPIRRALGFSPYALGER